MRDRLFEQGLKVRKEVIGEEYVAKSLAAADEFTMPIQELATKAAWGLVWTRPGIPRKWRSVLNLGMLVALNMHDELRVHVRGALRNGLTKAEIAECLLQSAVYCGFPAALAAFRTAKQVFAETADAPAKSKRRKK